MFIRCFTLLAAAALAAAGCMPHALTTPDQSAANFGEFTYRQSGAEDFCPDEDRVLEARLTRQPDGTLLFSASVIERAPAGETNCLGSSFACFVARPLPPRQLSEAESQRVHETFAEIPPLIVEFQSACVDPCLVFDFRWDVLNLDDTGPGCNSEGRRFDPQKSAEIRQMLEDLRQASEQPE